MLLADVFPKIVECSKSISYSCVRVFLCLFVCVRFCTRLWLSVVFTKSFPQRVVCQNVLKFRYAFRGLEFSKRFDVNEVTNDKRRRAIYNTLSNVHRGVTINRVVLKYRWKFFLCRYGMIVAVRRTALLSVSKYTKQ